MAMLGRPRALRREQKHHPGGASTTSMTHIKVCPCAAADEQPPRKLAAMEDGGLNPAPTTAA
jgi:hypothetical protein